MQEVVSETEKPKYYMPYGNRELAALSEQEKKALIVEALEAKGLRQTDAAALLNITRGYAAQLSKKRETGLLAPLAKIAKRSVKALVKGELVGQMTEIKGSDVLGACKEVLSRAEPVVNINKNMSLRMNVGFGPGDRERYLQALKFAQVLSNTQETSEKPQIPVLITQKEQE